MRSPTIDASKSSLMKRYELMIRSCINGDRQSQNNLYEMFAPTMFAVCLRFSKNREEAEEILQEGFIKVFKSLHTYAFAGSFEGWIRRIMVYAGIGHFRAKPKLHPVINGDPLHLEDADSEAILARLNTKDLLLMVQALPAMYRLVFNLYVFEGRKHREIASLLGISEGTSKSNLFDAKILLRKAIGKSLRVAKNY